MVLPPLLSFAAWILESVDTFHWCVFISSINMIFKFFICLFLLSPGHSYDLFYFHILKPRRCSLEKQSHPFGWWPEVPPGRTELCCPGSLPYPIHPLPADIPLLLPLLLLSGSFGSQHLELTNTLSGSFIVFIASSLSLSLIRSVPGEQGSLPILCSNKSHLL